MDTSALRRAAEEFAALLSEAAEGDLALPAGERTVGDLAQNLTARTLALAAGVGAPATPVPAPTRSDGDGGGFDRPFRSAVRALESAAAAAPSSMPAPAALATLEGDIAEGARRIGRALQLG